MHEAHQLTFPRTSNPLVSVLLPTRGRSEWLLKSVDSLHSQAVHKDKIEYLFRADPDDLETISTCSRLVNTLPNAVLNVEPRGRGYLDMHFWISKLASMARGDWLLIWNDDAMMKTPHWDDLLLNGSVQCWHKCPDVYMYVLPSRGRPGCYEFMFLRRSVTQILGHWSLSPHNDNWIMRVMLGVNSVCGIPIEVDHLSDRMTDKIREETVAAYGDGQLARETLESPWAQKAIEEDIRKLAEHIQKNV
jgi:hypothetical protein